MAREDWQERIEVNPDVLAGKPVVKGTRLGVEFIVGLLGNGWSMEEVLHNYPHLTHEDVLACLKFAQSLIDELKYYPLDTVGTPDSR